MVGLVLSIVARRDPALGRREALEDLWLATVCGLPLVILVIGVGEAPRNYLAQLAIGAGIAAAGWLWLFEAAMRRWPSLTILAVGAVFGPILGAALADVFGVRIRIGLIGGLAVGLIAAGVVAAALRAGRLGARSDPAMRGRAVAASADRRLVSAGAVLIDLDRLPPDRRDQGGGRRHRRRLGAGQRRAGVHDRLRVVSRLRDGPAAA